MNVKVWISRMFGSLVSPRKRRSTICTLRADELESRMLPSASPIAAAFATADASPRKHGADDPPGHEHHEHHHKEHHGHNHK